ncbi:hypothetical protein AB0F46_41305 [Streptomyces sp. NPDC026665]|uniref:hypothetical protein n=1 Tax=Streptomyces sp. NPDC026665 TaxID=3154798 RepID=UPI0033E82914
MTTTLSPEPVTTDTAADESHVVCCDDDVALCGTDVEALNWIDEDVEPTCAVCRELRGKPCRNCGF